MPVMLYKYLRADYAMQAIENKRLKVSFLDDLNDIYDCRPEIVYRRSFPKEKNKGFSEEFTERLVTHTGINCYCEKATSLLLWSHYGYSHKGVALGFDLQQEPFSMPDKPADIRILAKVSYENARKVIYWEDDIERVQEQHQFGAVLVRGYTVKGLDWKYEDEYREFVVLRESMPSGTLYFSKFRPGSLREVILGDRCGLKPRFVLDLIRHSKRNEAGYETQVLRARARNDSFRMDIKDAFKED
jgi:hypothetical protein